MPSRLVIHFVNEAFRHGKPIAFIAEGQARAGSGPADLRDEDDGGVAGTSTQAIEVFIKRSNGTVFLGAQIDSVPA